MPFRSVSEYCAPNRPPCHFDRIPGTGLSISRDATAHKSKVPVLPRAAGTVCLDHPYRRILALTLRSSGDLPLASPRQTRDYRWIVEDRACSGGSIKSSRYINVFTSIDLQLLNFSESLRNVLFFIIFYYFYIAQEERCTSTNPDSIADAERA